MRTHTHTHTQTYNFIYIEVVYCLIPNVYGTLVHSNYLKIIRSMLIRAIRLCI